MIYLSSYRPYDHLDEDELRRKLAEYRAVARDRPQDHASHSVVKHLLAEFQHRGLKT